MSGGLGIILFGFVGGMSNPKNSCYQDKCKTNDNKSKCLQLDALHGFIFAEYMILFKVKAQNNLGFYGDFYLEPFST